jgi:hypothetical protein
VSSTNLRRIAGGLAALLATTGCKGRVDGSRTLNNGSEIADHHDQAVVEHLLLDAQLKPFESCSGAILNDVPQILTAAHCVSVKTPRADGRGLDVQVLPAERLVFVIGDQGVRGQLVTIHPKYADLLHEYDLAVVTLPAGTKIPRHLRLAPASPGPDAPVRITGFGLAVADEDEDGDQIGIDDDLCPHTPAAQKALVEDKGPRTGCAPGEAPQAVVAGRALVGGGILRSGLNRVNRTPEGGLLPPGMLTVAGVDRPDAPAGQTTGYPGDSGSPVLADDGQGRLDGVIYGVLSAHMVLGGLNVTVIADVNQPENAAFLRDATDPAKLKARLDGVLRP